MRPRTQQWEVVPVLSVVYRYNTVRRSRNPRMSPWFSIFQWRLERAVEHGHGHQTESVTCDAWISPYFCRYHSTRSTVKLVSQINARSIVRSFRKTVALRRLAMTPRPFPFSDAIDNVRLANISKEERSRLRVRLSSKCCSAHRRI